MILNMGYEKDGFIIVIPGFIAFYKFHLVIMNKGRKKGGLPRGYDFRMTSTLINEIRS